MFKFLIIPLTKIVLIAGPKWRSCFNFLASTNERKVFPWLPLHGSA